MILCKATDFSRCLAGERVGEPASWFSQLLGLMKSYETDRKDMTEAVVGHQFLQSKDLQSDIP
jgi:hypothetical protein